MYDYYGIMFTHSSESISERFSTISEITFDELVEYGDLSSKFQELHISLKPDTIPNRVIIFSRHSRTYLSSHFSDSQLEDGLCVSAREYLGKIRSKAASGGIPIDNLLVVELKDKYDAPISLGVNMNDFRYVLMLKRI